MFSGGETATILHTYTLLYIVRKSPIYKGFAVFFVGFWLSKCVCVACVGICGVSEWLALATFDDFERHHPTLAMLEV